jgi:hypothetical protein
MNCWETIYKKQQTRSIADLNASLPIEIGKVRLKVKSSTTSREEKKV